MKKVIKIYFCLLTERLHRHCFDNIYIHVSDKKYHTYTFYDKIFTRILNLFQSICPDYRKNVKVYSSIVLRAYKIKSLPYSLLFYHYYIYSNKLKFERYK